VLSSRLPMIARALAIAAFLTTVLGEGGVAQGSGGPIPDAKPSAYDSPYNYIEADMIAIPNLGYGFQPWGIYQEGDKSASSGVFVGGPGTGAQSPSKDRVLFGLWSNPPWTGAGVTLSRKFNATMVPGQTLGLEIFMDWGGGWSTSYKGIRVIGEKGDTLFSMWQREGGEVFVNRFPAFCEQGDQPIKLRLRCRAPDELVIEGTGRDGQEKYSHTIRIESAPAGVEFFSKCLVGDNHTRRQLYFGEISIDGEASGEPWRFGGGKVRIGGVRPPLSEPGVFPQWIFFWVVLCGGLCGALMPVRLLSMRQRKAGFAAGFIVFSVLLVLPVWENAYLALGDAGGQLTQIATYSGWPENSDKFTRVLFTPYLAGTLLGGELGKILGPVAGYKVVLSLALLSFPLGCLALCRILGVSPHLVWAAFPFSWNYSHLWGFYGFMAAGIFGILTVCLAAWSSAARRQWLATAAIGAASTALAFGHAMAWGIFAMLAGVIILAGAGNWKFKMLNCLALVAPAFIFYFVLGGGGLSGGFSHQWNVLFNHNGGLNGLSLARCQQRLVEMLSYSIGRPDAKFYAVLGGWLLLWPALGGLKPGFRPLNWFPLITIVLFYLLAPNYIFDTYIIYPRSGPLLAVCAVLFWAKRESTDLRRLWFFAVGTAVFLSGALLVENRFILGATQQDISDLREVSRKIPKDSNVLLYLRDPGRNLFNSGNIEIPPAWRHIGGWVQQETGANVFPDLIDHASHFVMRRNGGMPKGAFSTSAWWSHSWCPANMRLYDFVLVKGGWSWEQDLLGLEKGRSVLVTEKGDWMLYRNAGRRPVVPLTPSPVP
jgi:hypothetical protein